MLATGSLLASENSLTTARFNTLWLEQGLPNNAVTSIVQDEQGFIWLGTFNGLSRYDGHQVKNYFSTEQTSVISDNDIRSLLVDSKGTLWIGTQSGGLNRFDKKQDTFQSYRHNPEQLNSLSSDTIKTILEGDNGSLWIGSDKGLDRFDIKSGLVKRWKHDPLNIEKSLPANTVRTLFKTSSGELWIGTDSGIATFDLTTQQFKKIAIPDINKPSLRAFVEDDRGDIWIACLQGLFKYVSHQKRVIKFNKLTYKNNRMLSLVKSNDGSIWAGSTHNGLFHISADDDVKNYRYDKSTPFSLADNVVMSLYIDKMGVLWAGTFNAGVSRIALSVLDFGLYNDEKNSLDCMSSPVVYSIHSDGPQSLWIGTQSGLIHLENSVCRRFEFQPDEQYALPDSEINSLYRDKNKVLWVGTNRGLAYFIPEHKQFFTLKGELENTLITLINEDSQGRLIVGSGKGLYIQDPVSGQFSKAEVAVDTLNSKVHSLVVTPQGKVIVGMKTGLTYLDRRNRLHYLPVNNGEIFSQPVRAMATEGSTLWLGSEKSHLFKLDLNTEQLNVVDLTEKFPAMTDLHGLELDQNNNLWISSSNGLIRLNSLSGKVHRFGLGDGLQSDVFTLGASFQRDDGKLFFGGRKGLNSFYSDKISLSQIAPELVFTNFYYFNQLLYVGIKKGDFILDLPANVTQSIVLGYKDYVFGIEFSALDFSAPEQTEYAYKMDGFDQTWNYSKANNRQKTYTNLAPGFYTFRVKAANKDGFWNEQGISLDITVTPAPWASGWAYLIYFIIFFVCLFGFIRYRTNSLKKRANQLQMSVNQRTIELVNEKKLVEVLLSKKTDEFANVSHEFRTPLTLILGPISQLLSTDISDSAKQKLRIVKRNGFRLLRMVEQLLLMEKFHHLQLTQKSPQALYPLLNLISQSFQDLAKEKNIQLSIGPIADVYLLFAPDALEKILLNLLSNAIKYTSPDGTVSIKAIKQKNNTVMIEVVDNGIGIPKEQQSLIFERFYRVKNSRSEQITGAGIGLALVREIVDAHEGEIQLVSTENEGTCISVILPIIAKLELQTIQSTSHESIQLELQNLSEQEPYELLQESCDESLESNKPSLLIVEDNPDMRHYIEQILNHDFYCFLESDGRAGVERALTEIPDLIISDVMMPVMDGYQLTKLIKSNDKTSHIPVILLTARSDRKSRLKGWYEKADEYLTKPFDQEEIKIRIGNLLAIRDILRDRFNQTAFNLPPENVREKKPLTEEELKLQAQSAFFDKLNQVLEGLYTRQKVTIPEIASQVAMGERQLFRKLKGTLNMNPTEYLRRFRLEKACLLLNDGVCSSRVALEVGFSTHSYFSRCFSAQYGCAPSEYVGQV